MCGFIAVLGQMGREELIELGRTIKHRGPDEQSYWSDGQVSVLFQRLSIVDPIGSHQPLSNEDGSVLVWFNGEIYNHEALRDLLQVSGHGLRERGDGEVISHLYEDFGARFPEYLEGMFAFLVYDLKKKVCWFGRDRHGIKPLFYQHDGERWMFASEVRPLLETRKGVSLNRSALAEYLVYRYVPTDHHQLVDGIQKVPAGTTVTLNTTQGAAVPKVHLYYTDSGHILNDRVNEGENRTSMLNLQMKHQVRKALTHSIKRHLMADVPLGVFLSGGVDSSIMVGLAREILGPDAPLHTFTVVFAEGESEGDRARQISDFHHTIHHELTITKEDYFHRIVQATLHWGGPVSEPAAIPTLMLSEFAKQVVTVVLTGEGADELFVGYPKYEFEYKLKRMPWLGSVPAWCIPRHSRRFGRLHDALCAPRASERNVRWFGAFSHRDASDILSVPEQAGLHNQARLPVQENDDSLGGAKGQNDRQSAADLDTLSSMLKFDRATWLSQNLLHKFDAMTMAASVEARVPFLDSEVVQTALGVPVERHLLHGTKSLLKETFADLVPPGYFQSPKNGFRVPVSQWLGELNLETMLVEGSLVKDGVLNKHAVKKFIEAFRRRPHYHDRRLWTLWALEVWYRLTFVSQQPENLLFAMGAV